MEYTCRYKNNVWYQSLQVVELTYRTSKMLDAVHTLATKIYNRLSEGEWIETYLEYAESG